VVDAIGHSLVNRQLMTSQLAQTGNSQYSPDLFMSTETPYYTAPSTCVRINTPQWSTEVAPSSSQNSPDLGMGNTVADQSQGNSQSQKSQDGQSSVAQTKGSGRVTKHATFDDEKKVLAYDTDATDSHGMQSQVAHTDVKRYSSEIPAPVESIRYFAPNTCSPVNAREMALRYSSDERSEADSGIGYMSRPSQKSAVTGSRNAVKRTSFNDERCALNSEVPANIVNTKGSSAREGAAKFGNNESLGQRDQVASEARPDVHVAQGAHPAASNEQ